MRLTREQRFGDSPIAQHHCAPAGPLAVSMVRYRIAVGGTASSPLVQKRESIVKADGDKPMPRSSSQGAVTLSRATLRTVGQAALIRAAWSIASNVD